MSTCNAVGNNVRSWWIGSTARKDMFLSAALFEQARYKNLQSCVVANIAPLNFELSSITVDGVEIGLSKRNAVLAAMFTLGRTLLPSKQLWEISKPRNGASQAEKNYYAKVVEAKGKIKPMQVAGLNIQPDEGCIAYHHYHKYKDVLKKVKDGTAIDDPGKVTYLGISSAWWKWFPIMLDMPLATTTSIDDPYNQGRRLRIANCLHLELAFTRDQYANVESLLQKASLAGGILERVLLYNALNEMRVCRVVKHNIFEAEYPLRISEGMDFAVEFFTSDRNSIKGIKGYENQELAKVGFNLNFMGQVICGYVNQSFEEITGLSLSDTLKKFCKDTSALDAYAAKVQNLYPPVDGRQRTKVESCAIHIFKYMQKMRNSGIDLKSPKGLLQNERWNKHYSERASKVLNRKWNSGPGASNVKILKELEAFTQNIPNHFPGSTTILRAIGEKR